MPPPYRAGLIGLGEIGSLYERESWRGLPSTHTGAFEAIEETVLVAACDLSEERRVAYAERHPSVRLFANAEEMLQAEPLDIVAIATPHSTHPDLVELCCRSGVRGIILEKPLAVDLSGADRILRACEEHGAICSVSYHRRWDPTFQELHDRVQSGQWGELLYLCGHMSRFKPYGWQAEAGISGGLLSYDPTHLLDLYLWFAGEPEWVSATVERRDKSLSVEDFVLATVAFRNGVRAHLEVDAYRDYFEFSLDLQLSRGRVEFTSGLHDNPYRLFVPEAVDDKWSFMRRAEFVPEPSPSLQVLQVRELVECLSVGGRPAVTPQEARGVVEVTLAIYESARLGGARVHFPLQLTVNPLEQMIAKGII